MRAVLRVNNWTMAWGLALLLLGIFHIFPAQAQQDTPTERAEQGEATQDHHHNSMHHHYKLIDIGTFGGPHSQFSQPSSKALNNRGMASGVADTAMPDPNPAPNCFFDCFVDHAFVSKDGVTTDLGTLPGGASSFAYWINNRGRIVGQSQIGTIDPLTGLPELRGVLWREGQIIDLGTLGGNASTANAINDRGQVVGGALTGTSDPFAMVPQASCVILPTTGGCSSFTFAYNALFSNATSATHAYLWQDGVMFDLGTLGGPDSTALINNDHGQVAGWSYTSFVANTSTGVPTVDPFIWSPEDREMVDLGGLGGTFGAPFFMNNRGQVIGVSNLAGDLITEPFLWSKSEGLKDLGTLGGTFGNPNWINDAGDVVGFSFLAGDQVGHAFLWRRGVMMDLGTLGNASSSGAGSINSHGQIVGGDFVIGGPDLRGWLWEHGGPIVDLNTLILPGSGLTVLGGNIINDRGEIAGNGILPNGDSSHAILLIPCDEDHADVEGCDYSMVDEQAVTHEEEAHENPASVMQKPPTTAPSSPALNGPSSDVRTMLRRRLGFNRFMGNAQQVALSGTAATSGPIATLSPTSETFSTQPIGTTSAAHTVTLKNTGTTSLSISRIAITGPDVGDCAQTHTCGSTLAAGASCNVNVTFRPTASGMRTAVLSVTDNAAGSPQKATLSGIGTAAKLSPSSLSFGSVGLRATSLPKTITLTNVGTTTLSIIGISTSGPNSGDFAQSHTCGSSLVAGASCTLRVTFTPAVLGARTAALNVTDNAAGSPQKVALSGVGVAGGKLTGSCVMGRIVGPPGCAIVPDHAQCTPGKPAINPVVVECGGPFRIDVDEGASCHLPGPFIGGRCQWTP